jgi:hypothetical protein
MRFSYPSQERADVYLALKIMVLKPHGFPFASMVC